MQGFFQEARHSFNLISEASVTITLLLSGALVVPTGREGQPLLKKSSYTLKLMTTCAILKHFEANKSVFFINQKTVEVQRMHYFPMHIQYS